jgi:hypothetical protein
MNKIEAKDIMLAVLSLDVYRNPSPELGDASFIKDKLLKDDTTGFFAAAYSYNNETIIAYRGTETPRLNQSLLANEVCAGHAGGLESLFS